MSCEWIKPAPGSRASGWVVAGVIFDEVDPKLDFFSMLKLFALLMAEPSCPGCQVPLRKVRAMSGEPWMECPYENCPGHERPNEPCWGKMRCFDEWVLDDGDMICFEACEGHHSSAGIGCVAEDDPYDPRP